jgi:hypothetical protein
MIIYGYLFSFLDIFGALAVTINHHEVAINLPIHLPFGVNVNPGYWVNIVYFHVIITDSIINP